MQDRLQLSLLSVLCRTWPAEEVARMLFGEAAGLGMSALEAAPACFACLAKPLRNAELSRNDVVEVMLAPCQQRVT